MFDQIVLLLFLRRTEGIKRLFSATKLFSENIFFVKTA